MYLSLSMLSLRPWITGGGVVVFIVGSDCGRLVLAVLELLEDGGLALALVSVRVDCFEAGSASL